jgi:hypothetical protein
MWKRYSQMVLYPHDVIPAAYLDEFRLAGTAASPQEASEHREILGTDGNKDQDTQDRGDDGVAGGGS